MSPRPPVDVWIDTDTAIGVPEADIDDALALIQAFHSPELVVRGVSSIFGNAPLVARTPLRARWSRGSAHPACAWHVAPPPRTRAARRARPWTPSPTPCASGPCT